MSVNVEFAKLKTINVHDPIHIVVQDLTEARMCFNFKEEDGAEVIIFCPHKMAQDVRDRLLLLYPLPTKEDAVGPISSFEEVEDEYKARAESRPSLGQE